ncbi:AMP-binding protein [Sanguibacter sp. A247]|uniref:AMP-binding protein n=1 Tax=unclassified Sanguibacter TaxID=2645534 RepID=UPI003FD875C8
MPRPVIWPAVSDIPDSALPELVRAALDGSGPALLAQPVPPAGTPTTPPSVPDDVALVVGTSGSTGLPRRVMLTASALRASATASAERLGGQGAWLLALPTTHIAGMQVIVRSVLAGTTPTMLAGPFRPAAFVEAVSRMPERTATPGGRRFASLVPTQLHRLLEPGPDSAAALDALRSFDAILVGGAALAPELAARAAAAGGRIVTTYGMSETCGGCVYDGVPLTGVRIRTSADGHVLISGRVLAEGFLDDDIADAQSFTTIHGGRWLRTRDLGTLELSEDSSFLTLTVHGRSDDIIITGGEKVAAGAVEAALAGWHGLGEVAVVAVPDDEWGNAIVAVATLTPGASAPGLAEVRDHVRRAVAPPAAPRALEIVEALPTLGIGKPDRNAVRDLVLGRRPATVTTLSPQEPTDS